MELVIESVHLMKEWNWEKNNELKLYPEQLTCNSSKKAWWICDKGHAWQAVITKRNQGSQCPFCTRRRALAGFNDLNTTHPEIAREWNYQKNGNLLPTMILSGSDKRVWWICSQGHEWNSTVYSRAQGSNCPHCNRESRVSENEIKIYYYLHKYFPNSIWSYSDKNLGITELDVFIPEYKTAIEYDGQYWHQDVNKDFKKDQLCYNAGINLIRVREPQCPEYQSTCEFLYLSTISQKQLKQIIIQLLKKLGIENPIVDFNQDIEQLEELVLHKKRHTISLTSKFPKIANEWHPTKNGRLTPEQVTPYSNKKVWWKCLICNTEWKAVVSDRSYGRGCPHCAIERKNKLIYCIELQKIFPSILNAYNVLHASKSRINDSCKDRSRSAGKHPVTGEKLHWVYVEDQVRKNNEVIKGAITLGYITQHQLDEYLNDCS